MDYSLAIENGPETIPGGTGLLLVHPSIGETDRIDTNFLKTDTDAFLVVSTRTTAREVEQKLEYYDVDETKATILDTLSVERGYSRRSSDDVYYVSARTTSTGSSTGWSGSSPNTRGSDASPWTRSRRWRTTPTMMRCTRRPRTSSISSTNTTRSASSTSPKRSTKSRRSTGFRDLFEGVIELDGDGNVTVDV